MDSFHFVRLPMALAILLLFCGVTAKSQDRATIRLKNSVFIKGVNIRGFDSTGVLLRLDTGGYFQKIDYSDIRFIKFLDQNTGIREKVNERGKIPVLDKLYHQVAIGILFGDDERNFSFDVVNGYKFNKYLQAGVGLGYDRYDQVAMLPVFCEIKGSFMQGKFVPYYFGDLGHGFVVEDDVEHFGFENYNSLGGLLWKVGMGYQLNFSSNAAIFSLAFMSQRSIRKYSSGDFLEVEENRSYHRVEAKIGFLF